MDIAWSQPTESVALDPNMLDVWAVRLGDRDSIVKPPAAFSAAERQRADQFALDEPRRRFTVTRAALRALLGNYLRLPPGDVPLETTPAGKPRLAASLRATGLHFSVAHSGELALIAVAAGCEVGVDVERVRVVSHAEHIARRYFHAAETQAIVAGGPSGRDAAFLRCWTGKEAVLKAIGSGITGSLASFRVPVEEFDAAWVELPAAASEGPTHCWLHALAPSEGYVGAVVCLGGERRVRRFLFES